MVATAASGTIFYKDDIFLAISIVNLIYYVMLCYVILCIIYQCRGFFKGKSVTSTISISPGKAVTHQSAATSSSLGSSTHEAQSAAEKSESGKIPVKIGKRNVQQGAALEHAIESASDGEVVLAKRVWHAGPSSAPQPRKRQHPM